MIRNDIDVRSLEFRVFNLFRILKSKSLRLDHQNLGYLIFYVTRGNKINHLRWLLIADHNE